jgi:large subunit ribosomal protein L25
MSNDVIAVEVENRKVLGKGLNTLRAEGNVPAVIHNHGKDSIHIMGDARALAGVFSKAGKSQPVEVKVGKDTHLTLIKDVDFDPIRHEIRHLVFQAIRKGEAVEAEVPVIFTADAVIPALQASLLVLKHLDHVQVKAIPSKLPDHLEVDPSSLVKEGDTISVADIIVPEGVTILTGSNYGIATVEVPKDQLAEADASAASLAEDAERSEEGDEATASDRPTETAETSEDSESEDKEA